MDEGLARDLRDTIAKGGDIVLHYLPEISLRTRKVIGVEALARWLHPRRGFVPPATFVPLAEEIGLLGPLTEWVLKTAIRQARVWRSDGQPLVIGVNLTSANLNDERLPRMVRGQLRALDVPGAAIALEIREAVVASAGERITTLAAALREIGVGITVDDVRSTASARAAVERVGASAVKIDRTLTPAIHDPAQRERVRNSVSVARGLGVRVAAQAIEDGDTLELFAEVGCDSALGFHIARPMPPIELASWLETSPWGLPSR